MRRLGLTQDKAARRMGISQPKVCGMIHGDFINLSERKLMECTNSLGYDIEINVRPATDLVTQHRPVMQACANFIYPVMAEIIPLHAAG
jgi:plasmid maintenance system antidote protein VapI